MPTRLVVFCILALMAGLLFAHDMFLKRKSFFLDPDQESTINLLNGTFEKSENSISRDRMMDVSIVGPMHERTHPDTSAWSDADNRTILQFKTGKPGTYAIGVSTAPRMITLSAEDFNDYLEHDGVLDVLENRKANATPDSVREKYSKHVKALIQVGDKQSAAFTAELEYPIEIIPLQNPYELKTGDTLQFVVHRAGKPVANQLVYASYDGFHAHNDEDKHREAVQTRTNDEGVAELNLGHQGRWYIRLIHMVASNEPDVDYESNWATLTFEIR